jgi:hypothetical protein
MTLPGASDTFVDLRIANAQVRPGIQPGLVDVGVGGHWIVDLRINDLWALGECIRLAVLDRMPLAESR